MSGLMWKYNMSHVFVNNNKIARAKAQQNNNE